MTSGALASDRRMSSLSAVSASYHRSSSSICMKPSFSSTISSNDVSAAVEAEEEEKEVDVI